MGRASYPVVLKGNLPNDYFDRLTPDRQPQFLAFCNQHKARLQPIYDRLGYDRSIERFCLLLVSELRSHVEVSIPDADALRRALEREARIWGQPEIMTEPPPDVAALVAVRDDPDRVLAVLRENPWVWVSDEVEALIEVKPDDLIIPFESHHEGHLRAIEHQWHDYPQSKPVKDFVFESIKRANGARRKESKEFREAFRELEEALRYSLSCGVDKLSYVRRIEFDEFVDALAATSDDTRNAETGAARKGAKLPDRYRKRTEQAEQLAALAGRYVGSPWMQHRLLGGYLAARFLSVRASRINDWTTTIGERLVPFLLAFGGTYLVSRLFALRLVESVAVVAFVGTLVAGLFSAYFFERAVWMEALARELSSGVFDGPEAARRVRRFDWLNAFPTVFYGLLRSED